MDSDANDRPIAPTFAPRSSVRPEGGFKYDAGTKLRLPFFPYVARWRGPEPLLTKNDFSNDNAEPDPKDQQMIRMPQLYLPLLAR